MDVGWYYWANKFSTKKNRCKWAPLKFGSHQISYVKEIYLKISTFFYFFCKYYPQCLPTLPQMWSIKSLPISTPEWKLSFFVHFFADISLPSISTNTFHAFLLSLSLSATPPLMAPANSLLSAAEGCGLGGPLSRIRNPRCRNGVVMKRRARLDRRVRPRNAVERKVRTLKKLIPNCEFTGVERLFRETADYIAALQMRVKVMQIVVDAMSGADDEWDEIFLFVYVCKKGRDNTI